MLSDNKRIQLGQQSQNGRLWYGQRCWVVMVTRGKVEPLEGIHWLQEHRVDHVGDIELGKAVVALNL